MPLAAQTLRLGVLSYQDRPDLVYRYQPVVQELNQRLQNIEITLTVADYEAIQTGIESHQYDLLIVDPTLYLWIRSRDSLSSVMATVFRSRNGESTSRYGGVVVVRADRATQISFTALDQYRIVTPSTQFWGTYWAQYYELFSRGLPVPSAQQVTSLGTSQATVTAILEGNADVGFLRTGQLERLIDRGVVSSGQLQVLNEQRLANYPYHTSTRLAPEWPVIALSHVDINAVRAITSALLNLSPENSTIATAGISGFVPAVDYLVVEKAMRELRLAPYDFEDQLNIVVIIKTYLIGILALVLVFLLLLIGLFTFKRQSNALAKAVAKEQKLRKEQDRHLQQLGYLFASSPSVVYALNPTTLRAHFVSANCMTLFGISAEEILATSDWWINSIHEADRAKVIAQMQRWRESGYHGSLQHTYCMQTPNGWIWVEDILNGIRNEDHVVMDLVGAHTNVSARKEANGKLELAASVFENAREGIAITDVNGCILEINGAFTRITGYKRNEIIGKNPRILNSGRQPASFYENMWQQILSLGFWEGEIWNRRKDGVIYAQYLTIAAVYDGQRKVSHYISLFSDITQQKENEQQLAHIAYFDALTGLPNRSNLTRRLVSEMQTADGTNQRFALGFLDLDGFKEINDTFGHDMGDLLLVEVAKRMRATANKSATVARFGGDEFVILLQQQDDEIEAERAYQQLLSAIGEPFRINNIDLHVSASIGITFFPQAKEIDADQLIRQADQAMYQAKIKGRNRLCVFNIDQESNLIEQHRLLEEIQLGLERDQFSLFYQPKVNMKTGEVFGYEALIRWLHPVRGCLAPGQFLPYVYQQPLELQLGEWVLRTALEQLHQWRLQGYQQSISINLAGFQLQQPDFTQRLADALVGYPDDVAKGLELEILETSAIEDLAHVSGVINSCKELGIQISLDDFGTGYSTLSHLKELSVDMLKIDHGFVRNMLESEDDLAIVKGVIGFADAFHLKVIAEGVETQAHADMLLALGCELGQGYLISRPIPPHDVLNWYGRWTNQTKPSH
ncbi:EAL domain-containing protein [Maribrevibacterium harenarium]|uniref:EAL domain-containing protein n=1 Tax=Maribrevibacterium harenarium TaxID=2589817 RepID=A0A501WZ01_9GAMM|nr:EAL domain-containing protein [Maribrevibacterium harenarium]TPE52867.1 EAL domain-containing protein [Maribrevibacterium harenarium]